MVYPAMIFFALVMAAPGCNRSQTSDYVPYKPGPSSEILAWSDEFDYTGLPDAAKWSFDTDGNATGWGNNESQYYTSGRIENAEVKDGLLNITARKEDYEG